MFRPISFLLVFFVLHLNVFGLNRISSFDRSPSSSAAAGEVNEAALVRDILYVFQGIDGKFIKMNAQDNGYKMDSKVDQRLKVLKLKFLNWSGDLDAILRVDDWIR